MADSAYTVKIYREEGEDSGVVKISHKETGKSVTESFGPGEASTTAEAAREVALQKVTDKIEGKEQTPQDYDPLLAQAERLPDFIKGADGDGGTHVQDVGAADEVEEESLEDGFGGTGIGDASTLTGD